MKFQRKRGQTRLHNRRSDEFEMKLCLPAERQGGCTSDDDGMHRVLYFLPGRWTS